MSTLALELADRPAALFALEPEWDRLWRRCPDATPFQSPHWLLPWWSQFGTPRPRAALLRGENGLAALLPLYVLEENGATRLLPIGVGISDYLDVLIAPDAPPDAAQRLLAAALDGTPCELPELRPQSPLREAAVPAGWRDELAQGEPCPLLALGEGCVPPRMRRKLRMNRHRADRAGQWSVERATDETFAEALEALIRLNDARWGERGVFADPRVRAFHAAAGPKLLVAGALRLLFLRFDGAIVAVIEALQDEHDCLFLHLGGFDAAHAFISPGTLLLGALIEQAIAEGRRELHFLRGNEGYKYAWGARDRHNATRRIWR